jgi:hypothetical protein
MGNGRKDLAKHRVAKIQSSFPLLLKPEKHYDAIGRIACYSGGRLGKVFAFIGMTKSAAGLLYGPRVMG